MLAHLIVFGAIPEGGDPPVSDGPVSLAEARYQCRVFDATEDIMLTIYIDAAVDWIKRMTKPEFTVGVWPGRMKLAALLLIGEYYATREVGSLDPKIEERALGLIRAYRPWGE